MSPVTGAVGNQTNNVSTEELVTNLNELIVEARSAIQSAEQSNKHTQSLLSHLNVKLAAAQEQILLLTYVFIFVIYICNRS